MNKLKTIKIAGIVCIIASWITLFLAGINSFGLGAVFRNYIYYIIYAIGAVAAILGCFFLSLNSHKMIISKNQKESFSTWFYLLFENASVLFGALLIEIDFVAFLTAKLPEPKMSVARLFVCSHFLVFSGLLGLSYRKAFLNIQTLLSLGIICYSLFDLCKTLSI